MPFDFCSFLGWFPKAPFHFGDEKNRQGLNQSCHPPPPVYSQQKEICLSPTPQHPVSAALENTQIPYSFLRGRDLSPLPAALQHPGFPMAEHPSWGAPFLLPGQRSCSSSTSLVSQVLTRSCLPCLGTRNWPWMQQVPHSSS